jgi:oxygen-dependent protoporphyrinogen oxidase
VWNSAEPGSGKPEGKLVPMPTGLGSLWRFPHRNALLRGFWRELKQPPLVTETEEASDESVMQFMTRRLGSVVAEELVDPMIAGIYAGDPYVLSMQSCLARVAAMERASGGILRDQAFQSKEVRARKAAEFDAQYDEHHAADVERQANPWRAKVMDLANGSGGIYTLEGGLATLVRALRLRLADDSNDPYTVVMRQRGQERDVPDAHFALHAKQAVQALHIDEHNKPVLHVADQQNGGKVDALQFDHAFSTLPTHALHSVLTAPQSSLPLSAEHRSHLAHVLSPQESMPFASVWVVNVVYPRGDILRPEQRGFGLLVPSKHTIRGLEVLGISYDSCIFPPQTAEGESAPSAETTETRLTVMLGGARHPWLATELDESGASLHALRAIEALMGIDHREARPTLVEATLQVDCIPQFLVGHAQKQHELHQLLQHLAYTPPSFTLPVVRPLPPLHVDVHEAGVRARAEQQQANNPPLLRPLTLLGTNYGVAVNDCIHHATKTAQEFAQRIKEQQQQ